jgi:hypothetical protein
MIFIGTKRFSVVDYQLSEMIKPDLSFLCNLIPLHVNLKPHGIAYPVFSYHYCYFLPV